MAQEDFKDDYERTHKTLDGEEYNSDKRIPPENIPTQNFILTHSYGNMAVRGYLCSEQFPETAPNSLEILDFIGSGIQNNQWQITREDYQNRFVNNSFYQDDVTKVIDRWGRTQTGVLDLAEGQNILTFKLANKVGMSNNQFLRIIKSSTPMQVC